MENVAPSNIPPSSGLKTSYWFPAPSIRVDGIRSQVFVGTGVGVGVLVGVGVSVGTGVGVSVGFGVGVFVGAGLGVLVGVGVGTFVVTVTFATPSPPFPSVAKTRKLKVCPD